jgi:hypothetical protein
MFDTMIVPLFVPQTPAFLVRKRAGPINPSLLIIKPVVVHLVTVTNNAG